MAEQEILNCDKAIENVDAMENIRLYKFQPNIEPIHSSISYITNFDSRFEDRKAYINGIGNKYTDEASVQSSMLKAVEQGQTYSVMLYTWRSCSRAIPPVTKTTSENMKKELYLKTLEVLTPEIEKITQFQQFISQAIRHL